MYLNQEKNYPEGSHRLGGRIFRPLELTLSPDKDEIGEGVGEEEVCEVTLGA